MQPGNTTEEREKERARNGANYTEPSRAEPTFRKLLGVRE